MQETALAAGDGAPELVPGMTLHVGWGPGSKGKELYTRLVDGVE